MREYTSDASSCGEESDAERGPEGSLEEEPWEDWEEQTEEEICRCLFSEDVCDSVERALHIDASKNGFDLKKFRQQFDLSFYDTICLVNYIRSERLNGRDPRPLLGSSTLPEPRPWKDESYLVPVLQNDAMILYDWEEPVETGRYGMDGIDNETFSLNLVQEYVEGMDLNDPAVLELIASTRHAHPSGNCESITNVNDDGDETARKNEIAVSEAVDNCYFSSYAFFDIHKEMLQDSVRTDCYRRALEENFDLIKGSSVLDVGCGTGVLSMFASRGGAAHVVGVDGSPPIAKVAEQICKHNGFDGKNGLGEISIISSKVELLKDLHTEGGKVDVIVSEWMGYALLFESMLDSVLVARDAFLRPNGAILPDIAHIYVAMGSYASEGLDFWDDIYGLSMTPIAGSIRKTHLKAAQIRVVDAQTLLSEPVKVHSLDLAKMKRSDQDFSASFQIKTSSTDGVCSCLVLWFDTEFSSRFCQNSPQVLSTSPSSKPTHWAQTVLPLPDSIPVSSYNSSGDGESAVALNCRLSMARQEKMHRTLDISLEYAPVLGNGEVKTMKTQVYSIGVNENHS